MTTKATIHRLHAFLRAGGLQQDDSGVWQGEYFLTTVSFGPKHEVVRDQRDGQLYRIEPIGARDPWLVPVASIDEATTRHAILEAGIADLRASIAVLPGINARAGDLMDQHRRHRSACQRLGEYLTREHGARVAENHDCNRIRMHGITSTSTGGLIGAYHNWIAAAERKLAKEKP